MDYEMPDLDPIFCAAIEIDSAEERAAYIARACAADTNLRRCVEKLVAAHFQAGKFLEAPCRDLPTSAEPGAADSSHFAVLGSSTQPGYLGRLGHYEVSALIGQGGMGMVFKAFDTVLHRVVAIKVLAPQLAANAIARKRFLREARAAAAVCHEHVVTIHAVAEQGGLPYLVMQYVAGISLHDKLKELGPLSIKEVLRIGLQTAQGLAAAHAHGLVHRDVKPANILLENGVERVKIPDFGLARAVDDASVSQSGAVAGTPQYMAPEQARGEPVSPRTDLFSLGCMLYAMGSGQAPFRGDTSLAVLRKVCEEQPRPLREANPDMPGWLVRIVDKLLAKAPDNRYQSATEVAELLQRHLAELQQPTGANPVVSAPQSVAPPRPPRRRRRWLWVGAVVLVLAAFACTWLSLWLCSEQPLPSTLATLELAPGGPDAQVVIAQDGKAVGVLDTKTKPMLELPPGTYTVSLAKGDKELELSAERVTLEPGGKQVLWVSGQIRSMYVDPSKETGYWLNRVAFTADGRHALATGGGVLLFDLETGKQVYWILESTGPRCGLALAPDGHMFLTAHSKDSLVRLGDVKSGKEVRTFDGHIGGIQGVAFAPGGKIAASGGDDGTVRIWDVATAKELQRLETGEKVFCVAFSPDGRQVVSGHWSSGTLTPDPTIQEAYSLRLWDVKTGQNLQTFSGHTGSIWDVAFLPDGKSLVSASADGTVRRWDVDTGQEIQRLDHPMTVPSLALSADGCRLVTGCHDGKMRLWDLAAGRQLYCTPAAYINWIRGVSLSPDGLRALTSDSAGTIRLWALPGPSGGASSTKGPTAKLSAVSPGSAKTELLRTFPGHKTPVWGVAIAPDGT
jgi:WD40 repeat protein/tRNA A-37 threonylcarbamoyl transferase component Bud32